MAVPKEISQTDLVRRTLALMSGHDVTIAEGREFMKCLAEAVKNTINDGHSVKIGGLVKFTPKFRLARKVQVFKEFGNPDSGQVMKSFPNQVVVGANVLKQLKLAVPAPRSSAAAPLKDKAEKDLAAREKRARKRAKEEKSKVKAKSKNK